MKQISIVSFVVVSLLLFIYESNATGGLAGPEEADIDETASDLVSSNDLEQEEEGDPHVRVERSPGWRRFRPRIRRPRIRVRKTVRKIGRAARKVVKKVKHGVRKVGQKVKGGVKKLAAKTKAAIKKAGSKLRGVARRAKDRVRSTVRRLKTKVKKVVKIPGDLAKKIRDRLKALIIKDKEEEEEAEEEEVIIEPEVLPTDTAIPTKPPKPVCNSACQFMKKALQAADFFKQSFCAFYNVRRQHRDFLLDRNFNMTLEYLLNEGQRESLSFYSTLIEVLQAENGVISLESRQKVSSDCAEGKLLTCSSENIHKALRKLACLKPCPGFLGCAQRDEELQNAINQAFEAFSKTVNRTLTLLGVQF